MLQPLRPSVAVLHIHMPRLSGLQIGRFVLQPRLKLELIMLTMDSEEALLNKALNLGIKGYLFKES